MLDGLNVTEDKWREKTQNNGVPCKSMGITI